MSEIQKPVEETPAVVPTVVVPEIIEAAPAPATEAPATEVPATETPAVVEEATEAPAKEETEEVVPATDGQLGYKGPGLVKSFRFVKRHFWFSEEAVESKNLATYFQNEKLSIAHPNAAWASQTGKGLLFFAKRAEDKATPAGIINLAEISDVVKEGPIEFHFKVNGLKHTFQATSADERASWIAAVEAKSAEGKAAKEEIVGGEGYKGELEKFTKVPLVGAVVGSAKKVTDEAKKTTDEATKTVESAVEPKDDKKSRSQSRKRVSMFSSFLGKREEQEEKKEEHKEEEKTDDKDVTKDVVEPAPIVAAETTAEPVATEVVEAPVVSEAVADVPVEEPKTEEEKTETPLKAKRTSIFSTIFQRFPKEDLEKLKKETAVETPAVSSTAPQLGDPVDASTSEPIKPETVTAPATEGVEKPKETEEITTPTSSSSKFLSFMKKDTKPEDKKSVVPEGLEKKAEEAVTKADETVTAAVDSVVPGLKEKRRTSLFGTLGGKKEKKPEVEGEVVEGETPKRTNSLAQLGGIFRKPSKAVKKEKEAAVVPTETEPIVEEPSTEVPAPVVAAAEETTTEAPKTTEEIVAATPAPVAASQPVSTAA